MAARVFDDTSTDLTWNIVEIVIWATVEVNLINISGMCLPGPLSFIRANTCCTASLPTIRPACTFIFTCTNPRTRTEATSGSYSNGTRERTKQSIRLNTMDKSVANDDSSSTHQLADSDDARGHGSLSDVENRTLDGLQPSGHYHSSITGQSATGSVSRSNLDGIIVKTETQVRVSER